MKIQIGVVLGLLLVSGNVLALDCNNAMNQRDINECSYLDFEKADKKLNKVYNQHRAKLSKGSQNQLKEAQLAWIKYRDLDCNYEADFYKGGSIVPTIFNGCSRVKTEQRIKEIEGWMEGIDY